MPPKREIQSTTQTQKRRKISNENHTIKSSPADCVICCDEKDYFYNCKACKFSACIDCYMTTFQNDNQQPRCLGTECRMNINYVDINKYFNIKIQSTNSSYAQQIRNIREDRWFDTEIATMSDLMDAMILFNDELDGYVDTNNTIQLIPQLWCSVQRLRKLKNKEEKSNNQQILLSNFENIITDYAEEHLTPLCQQKQLNLMRQWNHKTYMNDIMRLDDYDVKNERYIYIREQMRQLSELLLNNFPENHPQLTFGWIMTFLSTSALKEDIIHRLFNDIRRQGTTTAFDNEQTERTLLYLSTRCLADNCRGWLLKENNSCIKCKQTTCDKCLLSIGDVSIGEHECDKTRLDDVRQMKDDNSKQCPRCATFINRGM